MIGTIGLVGLSIIFHVTIIYIIDKPNINHITNNVINSKLSQYTKGMILPLKSRNHSINSNIILYKSDE